MNFAVAGFLDVRGQSCCMNVSPFLPGDPWLLVREPSTGASRICAKAGAEAGPTAGCLRRFLAARMLNGPGTPTGA